MVKEMGKVMVTATVENFGDVFNAKMGSIPETEIRRIEIPDALVDTGATGLMLPKRMIHELGLKQFSTPQARGIGGVVSMPMYSAVRLTIQGRECTLDVGEVADDIPALIGQIPLEALDWIVDPKNQRLIGNPEHGGEHMMDVFYGS